MIEVEILGGADFVARLDQMTASMSRRMVDAMYAIVNVVAGRARSRMAQLFRDPGRMQASVSAAVEVVNGAIIGTVGAYDLPYLAIQEFGGVTSPHDIFPVNAKALAFLAPGFAVFKGDMGTGDMVLAKVVHHPGSRIPERSYMRSALWLERSNIQSMIQEAVDGGARP